MTTIQSIQSRVEKEFDRKFSPFEGDLTYSEQEDEYTKIKSFLSAQILLLAQETYKAVRPEEKVFIPDSGFVALQERDHGYNQALKDLDANYSSLMGEGK